MNEQRTRVALAWYTPEEYVRIKKSAADPKSWCDDYETWRESAQSTLQKLTLEGMVVVKIPIVLHEFQSWCDEDGAQNDGSGRSRYAASKLQDEDENRA